MCYSVGNSRLLIAEVASSALSFFEAENDASRLYLERYHAGLGHAFDYSEGTMNCKKLECSLYAAFRASDRRI